MAGISSEFRLCCPLSCHWDSHQLIIKTLREALQQDSALSSEMRNRVGWKGGEKGAGSCSLSSQVTALACVWKGELSLTPSLVYVWKKMQLKPKKAESSNGS